mgnify:CR=1 FL=1
MDDTDILKEKKGKNVKDIKDPNKKPRKKRKTKEEKLKEEKLKEEKLKEEKLKEDKSKEDKSKEDKSKEEINNDEPVVVKRKRGRKKKIKTEEELERERNKPKQRRGRKPKSLMNNINSKNSQLLIDSCNNTQNDTIILNLKINDVNNVNNKQIQPIGYDMNEDIFSTIDNSNMKIDDYLNNDMIHNIGPNNNEDNKFNTIGNNDYNLQDIIVSDNDWVLNTNKTCYWCCHSFNNNSFGIPIKYKNDKFYVYGCFCSLECAAAYNFSEEKNVQDVWECYNLINLLSQVINYKNIVKLAPNKICLKMFGGDMTIDEFRNFTDSNKITNILEYPMISVSQQIEEINYDNSYNKNDYIPIDEDRVKKLEQKIKLMRTTPLLNHKNTLEHTMNIKIN